MSVPSGITIREPMERFYAAALRLYPAQFRETYASAMQQSLRDALRDQAIPRWSLLRLVIRDLVISLVREHMAILRDSITRPALVFNALVLGGIATGIGLALYAIPQHVLRSGLNDPQIQIATDLAARLEQGSDPASALAAGGQIDMARSLAPFAIIYDEQGRPVASQGLLNGAAPAPPAGVFDHVRQHGEDRLTWQPVRGPGGVRIAAVVERVNGAHPGFVLAGRNMREVEARIGDVQTMAGLTWLGMLGLILIGSISFGIYTRPRSGRNALAAPPSAAAEG